MPFPSTTTRTASAPAHPRNGQLEQATWDEAYDYIYEKLTASNRKTARRHRRHFFGALHQRGKLPDAEVHPRGDRHQQH
jgi:anaerobic selenocysteine-containing dehydrogenase